MLLYRPRSSRLAKKLRLMSTPHQLRGPCRLLPRRVLTNFPVSLALIGKQWKKSDLPGWANARGTLRQIQSHIANCSTLWRANPTPGSWVKPPMRSSSVSLHAAHQQMSVNGYGRQTRIVTHATSLRSLELLHSKTVAPNCLQTHRESETRFKRRDVWALAVQSHEPGIRKPRRCNKA